MKQFRNLIFGVLRTAIAVGLLLYLSTSGAIDWSAILDLSANWPITSAAFLLLFIALIIQSQRLCLLFRPHNMHLSLFSALKLNLMGLFFNLCLPGATGGDAVKIYYALEGNDGRRTEVATLLLFDRAVGMFGLLILPLLATFLFPTLIAPLKKLLLTAAILATLMFLLMLLCLMTGFRSSHVISRVLRRLPLGTYAERILDAIHTYRKSGSVLLTAVGLSLLNHCTTVLAMLLMAKATNVTASAGEICALVPLGLVANALPVTPGGLGVGEAAFDRLFAMAGIAGGALLLLSWRLLMILLGLMGLVFYLQGRKRYILDSISTPLLEQKPESF